MTRRIKETFVEATMLKILAVAVVTIAAASYAGHDAIVFGSFLNEQNAVVKRQQVIQSLELDATIEPVQIDRQTWYRVLAYHVSARDLLVKVRLEGFSDSWLLLESSRNTATAVNATLDRERSPPDSPVPSTGLAKLKRLNAAEASPLPKGRERIRRDDLEMYGDISYENRFFGKTGPSDQDKFHASVTFSPELYVRLRDQKSSFTFKPKFRGDSVDSRRNLVDIQDLSWVDVKDSIETRVGIRKDFWGVTETFHRVDIINQTDLVESFDGEDKLGQPMINLSFEGNWGTIDAYALLGFRERTFPGKNGRLRGPIPIDLNSAEYESGAKNRRMDFAIRWNQDFENTQLALSHFSGTSREPEFLSVVREGSPSLTPYYSVIEQTGIELLYIIGGMAVKLEAISRSGQGERFSAATAGFEYTQVGIFDTRLDLGWLMEINHDDRQRSSPIAVGTRLTFNDLYDSQILSGVLWNEDSGETNVFVEASRRIGGCCKLSLESLYFNGGLTTNGDNQMSEYIRDDDFVRLEFIYFLGS